MAFNQVFDKRLILVTGKGGSGKSTVSALMAKTLASDNKRVLVCYISSLSDDTWSSQFLKCNKNISQTHIKGNHVFDEYMLLKLKSKQLVDLMFNRLPALKALKNAAPALNELLLAGKIYFEVKSKNMLFKPKWDHVIVDLPSSGHALGILNIPKLIEGLFKNSIIAKESIKIGKLFKDSNLSALVLCSLAESTPVKETLEFCDLIYKHTEIYPIGIVVSKTLELKPSLSNIEYQNSTDERLSYFATKQSEFFKSLNLLKQKTKIPFIELPLIYAALEDKKVSANLYKTFKSQLKSK